MKKKLSFKPITYPTYSLVLNTSHGVFPENCDQAYFCMSITLLIPNRFWWDYEGNFKLAMKRYTINMIRIDQEMTELWHLEVCRVSYSSVSCIRDQRVVYEMYLIPGIHTNMCLDTLISLNTSHRILFLKRHNFPQISTIPTWSFSESLPCHQFTLDHRLNFQ